MMEIACTCDDLPAHSHVYQAQKDEDNRRINMVLDHFDVRIWVDWRAVARSYSGLEPVGPVGPNQPYGDE